MIKLSRTLDWYYQSKSFQNQPYNHNPVIDIMLRFYKKKVMCYPKKYYDYSIHGRSLLQIWWEYPKSYDDSSRPSWNPRTNVQNMLQTICNPKFLGSAYWTQTYWNWSKLPLPLLWKNIQKQKSQICPYPSRTSCPTLRIPYHETTSVNKWLA